MFKESVGTLGLALGLLAAGYAQAATFTVNSNADSGAGSLRNAIQSANVIPGPDAVVFDPNTMTGATITLTTGPLFVTDELTITGLEDLDRAAVDAADTVTISGNSSSQVFVISARTSLSHLLVIAGAANADGGCIVNSSELTISDSVVAACAVTGGNGGAIFNATKGKLTIFRSVLSTALADDGGLIYSQGPLTVIESHLTAAAANDDGGAIYSEKSLTLRGSSVTGTGAADNGGGIYARGLVTIVRSTLSGNTLSNPNAAGGGLFVEPNATVAISESTLAFNNVPATGAASALRLQAPGTAQLSRNVISDNFDAGACQFGGVVPAFASVNLADDPSCAGFTPVAVGATALQALAANNNLENPTLTHALGMGSAALDRIACGSGVDQRDVGRLDGLCDVGAYEEQPVTVAPACTMAPAAGCTVFLQGKLKITEGVLSDATDRFKVSTKGVTPNENDFGDPNDVAGGDAQSLCVYSGGNLLNEYNVNGGGGDPVTGRLLWSVGKDAKSANYNNPPTNIDGVKRVRLRGGDRGRFDVDARGTIIEVQQDLPEIGDFPLRIQQVSSNGFCAEIVFDDPEVRGNSIQAQEKP